MSYTVKLVKYGEYVSLLHEGSLEESEVLNSHQDVRDALAANNWTKILIDISQIKIKPSIAQQYNFICGHATQLPWDVRIALLVNTADMEMACFVETLAHNRGMNLWCFCKKDEGLMWLLSDKGYPNRDSLQRQSSCTSELLLESCKPE